MTVVGTDAGDGNINAQSLTIDGYSNAGYAPNGYPSGYQKTATTTPAIAGIAATTTSVARTTIVVRTIRTTERARCGR